MYPAYVIAYAFVKKGIEEGKYVSQMKLQKMVYFAHGIHLATTGQPLITEEFQAWKYGPVAPSIYQAYKLYGSGPILNTDYVDYYDPKLDDAVEKLSKKAIDAIDITWLILKNMSALQLSNWSHTAGAPWANNYISSMPNIIIPNDQIKEYFEREFTQEQ